MNFNIKDIKTHRFLTLDSTNLEAKRLILSGEKLPFCVVADSQTNGRGRLSRSFYSPNKTGLYFTIALPFSDFEITTITAKTAVAVCKALEEIKVTPGIKWVNDIYLNNRKICGILAEAVNDIETGRISSIIIGIGINVTTVDFPRELSEIAGSIQKDIDKNMLMDRITINLLDLIYNTTDFLSYYKSRSIILNISGTSKLLSSNFSNSIFACLIILASSLVVITLSTS